MAVSGLVRALLPCSLTSLLPYSPTPLLARICNPCVSEVARITNPREQGKPGMLLHHDIVTNDVEIML